MAEFIKIATTDQIAPNSIKEFSVKGDLIAIANLNNTFLAVANVCTHDGGPIGEGQVVNGCCVECPRHGARFDLKTGAVMTLPATVPLKTYEVKVEGSDILVKV